MEFSAEDARNLEVLLESLIKMVGKSNQRVDSLERRVNQLERFIQEQLADSRKPELRRIYFVPETRSLETGHEQSLFHPHARAASSLLHT